MQADFKGLVLQLNKGVKSVCTATRWSPHLKSSRANRGSVQREPNAYRSMRDHIHPPRVSAPSCIIPLAEDVAVRPYLVPLLLTFHGMENEKSIHTHPVF